MVYACVAAANAQVGEGYGLKPRGAEAVDGEAGNIDRQTSAQDGHARDIPAGLAFGLGAAQDDIVELRAVEGRDPVESRGDGQRGQIVGAGG